LHDLGFLITYHTCGGTSKIEDYIVANGCDASETLAPVSIGSNQDPWDYKKKIGNRVALIGGMDQFKEVGYEGGYILSCADHFFETPVENIRVYAEAARECVY